MEINEWILLHDTSCTIMAISRQKEARRRDYALLLIRMTSRFFFSAQYHKQHSTLQAFEQFGALYIYAQPQWQISGPTRGFEPGTSRLHPQSIIFRWIAFICGIVVSLEVFLIIWLTFGMNPLKTKWLPQLKIIDFVVVGVIVFSSFLDIDGLRLRGPDINWWQFF